MDKDLTLINQTIVKNTIYDLIAKQELPATAKNLTITTPRTSSIYFLPKIHRPNNPGRPIVSVCSCSTEVISSYLDKIMAPIVKTLPSYIKDSQHELEIFRYFSILGQNSLFSPEILHIFILSFLKTKVTTTIAQTKFDSTCAFQILVKSYYQLNEQARCRERSLYLESSKIIE